VDTGGERDDDESERTRKLLFPADNERYFLASRILQN
jgi:hypothetical protein